MHLSAASNVGQNSSAHAARSDLAAVHFNWNGLISTTFSGPSGDDSIEINVHELPPDSVEVQWKVLQSISDYYHYYFDLKVTNRTSGEYIMYERIKGNLQKKIERNLRYVFFEPLFP